MQVFLCYGTAVTEYHGLDGFQMTEIYISQFLRLKVKGQDISRLGIWWEGPSFPMRGQKGLFGICCKGTNPIHGGLHLWPRHLSEFHFLNPVALEISSR